MKPKSIDRRNERNSYSQWISGTSSAWKKTIFLTSAAVFIWLISASLRQSCDEVNNLEKKIKKQTAGFARLAMISSSFKEGLADVEFSHHSFISGANPPEAIEVVDMMAVAPEPCSANAKQECKADSHQKAEDKRKAAATPEPDSTDTHTEKTTTTATRKSTAPSQPHKSKTIGQRHFGVGLKLSI